MLGTPQGRGMACDVVKVPGGNGALPKEIPPAVLHSVEKNVGA